MDLKSFSGKEAPEQKNEPMDEAGVKSAINHYSKMSNDQLMGELFKQVASQKAKGQTSNMHATVERIKPLLNAEQKKKLESILKQVEL